ncbi:[citrate (pro-3S)-lyase] ligase [Levilactobacillus bambusae]|uniref:[Citrate [pro-3S]-lyase] ligase n=1 Tax=Levilactobacillus bambusae TaxID=2024736 RepID=A0A2V1N0S2_9LACO|nr:[citrate (pro-3S)-lyase] ligase [Levilactobacillus bambusae]PWG00837.1 [citrate (pro-3S)-lyase] ligase [Levilactobacillus bambusae]
MAGQVVDLYLNQEGTFNEWQTFLQSLGISNFSTTETSVIDETVGIFDGDRLVATGSVSNNVLKYIGVCNQNQTQGTYFNMIVTELLARLAQRGIFHVFVFTKPQYSQSFQHLGFSELAQSADGALLETGDVTIQTYLDTIPQLPGQSIAGIVMNANPFTRGHRYLVERAAEEADAVYVFVVNTDSSLFTTEERVGLVTAGLADLNNVLVVSGGDYMVSYATFPAYFLTSPEKEITYQTTLDARIFKNWVAKERHITTRYVGSEPRSRTTAIYNSVLQRELPPEVAVKVIERRSANHDVISARTVREMIAADDLTHLAVLVPDTTAKYIQEHLTDLQKRIKKGMKIDGN